MYLEAYGGSLSEMESAAKRIRKHGMKQENELLLRALGVGRSGKFWRVWEV